MQRYFDILKLTELQVQGQITQDEAEAVLGLLLLRKRRRRSQRRAQQVSKGVWRVEVSDTDDTRNFEQIFMDEANKLPRRLRSGTSWR